MSPLMTPAMPPLAVPGQALFENPAPARDVLARVLDGEIGPGGRITGLSACLRHGVPFKRSSFELELTIAHGSGKAPESRQMLAKLYVKDHGPRAFEVLHDLRNRGFSAGPCRVPKPLGYDPTWRLLLLDWAPGSLLGTAILDGPDGLPTVAAVERAGLWLAHLHRCGATAGRVYTFERHLHTLSRWAGRIAALLPATQPLLVGLLSWIEERGNAVSGWVPGPTHRDFSPDHLVMNGDLTTGLDFDEFCQYDRLFDVAHFVVHLRCLALESPAIANQLDRLASAFSSAYRALAPEYLETRLALYSAISYFKLAHISAVVTRPPDWQDRAVFLLDAARGAREEVAC